jgi:hypothetical protein
MFGATFPTAEHAASAADRALIAMWGFKAAEPYLHFPQPNYYKIEEQQQRFGHHLTSFLQSIVDEAVEINKERRKEQALSYQGARKIEFQRRRKIRRLRDTMEIIDERKDCGLCSACRQPWLSLICERKAQARQVGYNSLKVAEKMFESGVEVEEDDVEDLENDSDEEEEENEEERETGGSDAAATAATTGVQGKVSTKDGKSTKSRKKLTTANLLWLKEPPKGKAVATARWNHSSEVDSLYKHTEAMATATATAEVSALTTALEASRIPGLATTFPPRDFMMAPPQPALLRHAMDCAAAGVDLTLVGEEDPRWGRPLDPRAVQCRLCHGWHPVGMQDKECPVNQAANAVEPPRKELCSECGGIQGCARCGRGALPAAVWAPASVPCAWIDNVKPATLDVMHSVQSMASAAAFDFDRTDVAGKLGPEALLALGLLAEEVAAAQATATMNTSL